MMSTILVGCSLPVAPAWAQSAPASSAVADEESEERGGEIIVTGSRIARPDLSLSSPVQVIGEAEFNLRQPSSVEQLLRDIPGVAPGINAAVNNGTNGTATFNLRGLGANRNLVLLNGRRVVPAGLNNVVDLNIIPVALVQRADVLTGGAVTSYGADAIAGLVNFITNPNFSGVDFRANYGITERGDGRNFRSI
jgi:outer membrane cobalamin receptor